MAPAVAAARGRLSTQLYNIRPIAVCPQPADGERRLPLRSRPVRLTRLILVALPLLIAGCGSSSSIESNSSSSASTATPPSHATNGWTGFGATLANWESAHPKSTEGCTEGCYGGQVEVAPNEFQDEFHGVLISSEGRVDHYEQDLGGSELDPAAAEQAALAMLPHDTRVISSEVSHENGSCKIITVQSNDLGRWFADRKGGGTYGLAEIDLHGVDPETGESTYPAHLSEASVSVGQSSPGC